MSGMLAQGQRGGDRGGRGGDRGGQRGSFDRSQFMDRIMGRYQDVLALSDDEWAVIKPMVSKVLEAQRGARGTGGMGMLFGRGGGPGGDRGGDRGGSRRGRGGESEGPSAALKDVLDEEGASASEIKAKLEALRKDRAKKAKDLAKARNQLKQVLTVKQEATLVLMGVLE